VHAQNVQRHEHCVGTHCHQLGVERRKLHVDIRPNGQRNGWWRKDKLDQCGKAGDIATRWPKGTPTVLKRPTRVRDRRGQLGKAEDEGGVHQGHKKGGDQKTQGTGRCPAVAPAKIFARYDQADSDTPKLQGSQRLAQSGIFFMIHECLLLKVK